MDKETPKLIIAEAIMEKGEGEKKKVEIHQLIVTPDGIYEREKVKKLEVPSTPKHGWTEEDILFLGTNSVDIISYYYPKRVCLTTDIVRKYGVGTIIGRSFELLQEYLEDDKERRDNTELQKQAINAAIDLIKPKTGGWGSPMPVLPTLTPPPVMKPLNTYSVIVYTDERKKTKHLMEFVVIATNEEKALEKAKKEIGNESTPVEVKEIKCIR